MPRDLLDLLGDALPRDAGAPDLGAIESRVVRRRAGRLGGVVLALAAVVAIGVQVLPLSPPAPMIDRVEDTAPAGTTVLPLPPAGEVAAAHANGRPVFVVHDEDGEVRVLDAISPHGGDPYIAKVLAYCTTSGWFVDPWHGSKFASNGAWVGGPAPYGLAEHEVVRTTGDSVVVGALQSAPSRGGREGSEPIGPGCGDTLSGVRVDDFLLHTATETALVPGLHYAQYPEDGGDSGLLLPDQPQVPLPGDDATLPLPAPGEVSADHVNGRPVFVRNNGDGNVLVLDAVNPHVTEFGPKVLAWCRRDAATNGEQRPGGIPVDLWYGSRFASQGFAFGVGAGGVPAGGWTGGPAPTGLGQLPVRTVTSETVTVAGSPLPAPPRVNDDTTGPVDPDGSDGCGEAVALFPDAAPADPTILGDLVLHQPLFADDWWYPTPARILGEEPGLPPDELERYLEEAGFDPDELRDLDAACARRDEDAWTVDDIDLDGDGAPDYALPAPGNEQTVVVACLGDGRQLSYDAARFEDLSSAEVGGRDALFVGGTTAYASVGFLLRVVGDELTPLDAGDEPGPDLTFGSRDAESWAWGCRAARDGPEEEIVTVHTEQLDDGAGLRVTAEVYGVAGASMELIDTATETRDPDPASEHPASDVADELGLRLGCGRSDRTPS